MRDHICFHKCLTIYPSIQSNGSACDVPPDARLHKKPLSRTNCKSGRGLTWASCVTRNGAALTAKPSTTAREAHFSHEVLIGRVYNLPGPTQFDTNQSDIYPPRKGIVNTQLILMRYCLLLVTLCSLRTLRREGAARGNNSA
jgi:hypothetical protein